MGFPTEFFPVLFAIPRMAGYLSHWRESLDDPDTKIMRPAQVSFHSLCSILWLNNFDEYMLLEWLGISLKSNARLAENAHTK